MGFADYAAALEFRSVLRDIVKAELDRQRPPYQLAIVTGIDRPNRKCQVQFNGETTSVTVNMGSIQPNATGQAVRVDGRPGDRFIAEVLGDAYDPLASTVSSHTSSISGLNSTVSGHTTSISSLNSGLSTASGQISALQGLSNGLTPAQNAALRRFGGANLQMEGGFYCDSANVWWSSRIMTMGAGRNSSVFTGGYVGLTVPANGTVVPVHGKSGTTSATVADGKIPLASWQALYYDLPFPSGISSDDSRWHIVDYTLAFDVPSNWIFVTMRMSSNQSIWGNGLERDWWKTPTLLNSWVNYGSSVSYASAGYKRENGMTWIKGLVKDGTFSTTTSGNIFVLPAGFWPTDRHIFGVASNNALGRLDIIGNGEIRAISGDNTWFSLGLTGFPSDGV